jgi:hypothetical protein
MTIKNKDIPAALVDIHTKLADKLGGQPCIEPYLKCSQAGKWTIGLWFTEPSLIGRAQGDTPTDVINAAFTIISGMVSKEEQIVIDWQKDLAKVIDDGHDLNLPDNVLAPLRASSQAMTENLLTVAKT